MQKKNRISNNNKTPMGKGSSNNGDFEPESALLTRNKGRFNHHARIKASLNATDLASQTKYYLTRNMSEKKVHMGLWMIEGKIGFDEMTEREKMTFCVKNAVPQMRERYYSLGLNNNAPATYETFKAHSLISA